MTSTPKQMLKVPLVVKGVRVDAYVIVPADSVADTLQALNEALIRPKMYYHEDKDRDREWSRWYC